MYLIFLFMMFWLSLFIVLLLLAIVLISLDWLYEFIKTKRLNKNKDKTELK